MIIFGTRWLVLKISGNLSKSQVIFPGKLVQERHQGKVFPLSFPGVLIT
jgi:hypothetical protein